MNFDIGAVSSERRPGRASVLRRLESPGPVCHAQQLANRFAFLAYVASFV
jgi:hypothetical protein